jgi:hypothetical protein
MIINPIDLRHTFQNRQQQHVMLNAKSQNLLVIPEKNACSTSDCDTLIYTGAKLY